MIGKKINQLATELAPVSTDLTIIGDPTTGVSKKITLAQLGAIFSGAVSFYDNLASFPATGDINVIYCAKDTKKLYLWSGSAYVEVFPSQALLDTYQLRSEKGVSNGYASLDSSGKVPVSQLPSSIMEYKGTWNAATNTPTLANGTGDTGDVYICNVAGTVNFGAGPITFAVGDYVIYSGSIWQRSSGAVGTVTSVAASITGDAIGITGSPVTTSGTLAFAFAGTGAQYIKGDGTLATFPSTIAQAQNLIAEVYNSTGATLTKGTIVYINGGQGNLPTVTKAIATGDSTSAQTFGVVQSDITNNNNGYVVVSGRLENIDTQAFSVGAAIYLSGTTAGAFTSTKPYAPTHLVYIGVIVRSHPTQGVIEVKIQNGYELDELHNVAAQSPSSNDGLFWEASTSLWKNKSIATILGYTPQAQLNGTGFVKASGTTITYDNSTYLTTSAAASTYLPMVLSSTAKSIELNGQTFDIASSAGGYTSGRLIVSPTYTAIGYQSSGIFKGLQILTDGTANFFNTGLTRFYNAVRFDSTISNGTYTYTLPGATGTLALTSDIPTVAGVYLPLSGGTLTGGLNGTSATFSGDVSARNVLVQDGYGLGAGNFQVGGISGNRFYIYNGTLGIDNITISPSTGVTTFYRGIVGTTGTFSSTLRTDGVINWNGTVGALSYGSGFVTMETNSATQIRLVTNGTTALTLATNQAATFSNSIGIGSSPSSWGSSYLGLQVNSAFSVFGYASTSAELGSNFYFDGSSYRYTNTGTSSQIVFNGASMIFRFAANGSAGSALTWNPTMVVTSGGNVGIGTTSPSARLDVVGSAGIRINEDGAGTKVISIRSDFAGVDPAINVSTNNALLLMTNNTERLRVSSGGNVGIGTTSPGARLDLGSSYGSPKLYLYNDGTYVNGFGIYANEFRNFFDTIDAAASRMTWGKQTGGGTFTEFMRLTKDGNVGIGTTSPTSKLHVVGLPTSSAGLTSGAIWNDGGTLKIV